jgi:hypothetical protein
MSAEDRRWRLRHLPTLLGAAAVVTVVAAVVGGLTAGGAGAAGAGIGVALASFSFALSTVILAWADAQSPQLVLPFGLGLYVTKFSLLGGVMIVMSSSGWAGMVPMGWGIAAGVVAWTGVHIWWLAKVWPATRHHEVAIEE